MDQWMPVSPRPPTPPRASNGGQHQHFNADGEGNDGTREPHRLRLNDTSSRSGKLPAQSGTASSNTPLAASTDPPTIVRLQLFPHSDRPAQTSSASHPDRHRYTAFAFTPVEKDLRPGSIVRIGRKVDRHISSKGAKEKSRSSRGDKSNNVAEGVEEMEFVVGSPPVADMDLVDSAAAQVDSTVLPGRTAQMSRSAPTPSLQAAAEALGMDAMELDRDVAIVRRKADFVAFRSKVVSRTHAEIWVGVDGQVFFRDVGSSSGTFLNRLRLSPSGKESIPYPLKNGDVIQLGVDYQGRQEEIYKCVMIKVFVTVKVGFKPKYNPVRLRNAVKNLVIAMNPTSDDSPTAASDALAHSDATSDCCICLCSISPFQALFLAPCSHCFHYKCVTPLLGSGVMFLCPMCRQVANLEANVAELDEEDEVEEESVVATTLLNGGQSSGTAAAAGGSGDNVPEARNADFAEVSAHVDAMDVTNDIRFSPSKPRSISGRPRPAEVEARLQEFLSEADAPVPRVTANDLDALLSDGEGTSTSTSNLARPDLGTSAALATSPPFSHHGSALDLTESTGSLDRAFTVGSPDAGGITLGRPSKTNAAKSTANGSIINRHKTKVNHRTRPPAVVMPGGMDTPLTATMPHPTHDQIDADAYQRPTNTDSPQAERVSIPEAPSSGGVSTSQQADTYRESLMRILALVSNGPAHDAVVSEIARLDRIQERTDIS